MTEDETEKVLAELAREGDVEEVRRGDGVRRWKLTEKGLRNAEKMIEGNPSMRALLNEMLGRRN